MKTVLIVGGAGFIGINSAEHYLKKGEHVIIFDNFLRKGAEDNVSWIKNKFPNLKIVKGDISKDTQLLLESVKKADVILHLAAQVAVTTSVTNPRLDFETNALGSFNVLEAVRQAKTDPVIIYSSTNKVYGGMNDIKIIEKEGRYEYKNYPHGIDENRQLDFHSPYGCSKGCGDQYFIDYARIYGLKTVVFRQSCIYGPNQFGMEDQGWLAWLTIAAYLNKQITIYGDGKQVRDVLYISDLLELFDKAIENIEKIKGKAYNIGGGANNTLSLLELIKQLEGVLEKEIPLKFSSWRPGDQKTFVCDIRKAKEELGWEPKVTPEEGVIKLFGWVKENKDVILKHVNA